jgi:hypothetical protein
MYGPLDDARAYPFPMYASVLGTVQASAGTGKNNRLRYEIKGRENGEHLPAAPFLDRLPGLSEIDGREQTIGTACKSQRSNTEKSAYASRKLLVNGKPLFAPIVRLERAGGTRRKEPVCNDFFLLLPKYREGGQDKQKSRDAGSSYRHDHRVYNSLQSSVIGLPAVLSAVALAKAEALAKAGHQYGGGAVRAGPSFRISG